LVFDLSLKCGEHTYNGQVYIEDEVIAPLEELAELSAEVKKVRAKTNKVAEHSSKLISICNFIPKFGKVAKTLIKVRTLHFYVAA
jgi:hypothetical protein